MKSKITAISYFFPERLVFNGEIENELQHKNQHLHVPENIIEITTGIQSRRFCRDDEYNSTLASSAGLALFKKYNINPKDIDLLIFASAGQDLIEPATSHIVQDTLKTNCRVFDIKNACNAFIDGLIIADSCIKSGLHKNVLIVTGEASSKSIKWSLKDRADLKNSFPGYTLGDMGTAVLVQGSNDGSGLVVSDCLNDSSKWEVGTLPTGGSRHPRGDEYTYFRGDGPELKNSFERIAPNFFNTFLEKNKINKDTIDHICMHQVSEYYLNEMTSLLKIDDKKIIHTAKDFGNVAAATLPLQLALLNEGNKLKKGDSILLIGLAGGVSVELVYFIW
jgi:3-oxoacyl-[acyl-carrier-protein] synthase-3